MEVLVTQGYTISLTRANWTRAGHLSQTELFFQEELRTRVLGCKSVWKQESERHRGPYSICGPRKDGNEKRGGEDLSKA